MTTNKYGPEEKPKSKILAQVEFSTYPEANIGRNSYFPDAENGSRITLAQGGDCYFLTFPARKASDMEVGNLGYYNFAENQKVNQFVTICLPKTSRFDDIQKAIFEAALKHTQAGIDYKKSKDGEIEHMRSSLQNESAFRMRKLAVTYEPDKRDKPEYTRSNLVSLCFASFTAGMALAVVVLKFFN